MDSFRCVVMFELTVIQVLYEQTLCSVAEISTATVEDYEMI